MKLADERAPPSMPSKTLWPHRFSGVRGRWRNSPTFELQPRTGDGILSEMPLHCQLTYRFASGGIIAWRMTRIMLCFALSYVGFLSVGKPAKMTFTGGECVPLDDATLTISSKNYSSWSLRGWLMTKFSGLPFSENVISPDDPAMRAELLLLSSSFLVPCLSHNGIKVWDTLAIGEYLNEIMPAARLLPEDRVKRTHCRSISGEMHSGFGPMRSALPVNLKGDFPTSRSGRAPRPISTGLPRSGENL